MTFAIHNVTDLGRRWRGRCKRDGRRRRGWGDGRGQVSQCRLELIVNGCENVLAVGSNVGDAVGYCPCERMRRIVSSKVIPR
jgi:hypothetical protein